MRNSKIDKKKTLLFLSITCLVIVSKILLPKILPSKYYSDSATILRVMRGEIIADKSYTLTAAFFNAINILNFNSLLEWSLAIGVLAMPILFYLANKRITLELKQTLYFVASIFLLGLYVLTVSKDFIHTIVIIIIYAILIGNSKEKKKLITVSVLLLIEGVVFRRYYIIISLLMLVFYKQTSKKREQKMPIMACIAVFMVGMALLQLISPNSFNAIVGARETVNLGRNEINASTLINDVLPNNNLLFYFLNFIINFIRLAFPLELLVKSPLYIVYVIYQLYITYVLIVNSKRVDANNRIALSLMLAYFTTSVLFEPDFGSFLRHESVYFLIVILLTNSIRSKPYAKICN